MATPDNQKQAILQDLKLHSPADSTPSKTS